MKHYIPIDALNNAKDFSERRNDWVDLSFAKVGVFNPVDINDSLKKIIHNKIPERYYWEYQKTQNFGFKIVTPVELKTVTKRSNNLRKIKSRKYNLDECIMS